MDYEACLYNPSGTIRRLTPITNNDMQNVSISLMNMSTNKAITKGNTEIKAEELMVTYISDDFYYVETLYRVLIPTVDNMFAETASRMSEHGEGWERIRNSTINRVMQYDSTVKLWDATRRRHPLFQQLPHTIYHGNDSEHYLRLRRLNIPTELKTARKEFRNLIKLGHNQSVGYDMENTLGKWNFDGSNKYLSSFD